MHLVPAVLGSACLEVLAARGGICPPVDTAKIPLYFKLWLSSICFKLLVHKKADKGISIILSKVIDINDDEEVGLLLHNRDKEKFGGNGIYMFLGIPLPNFDGKWISSAVTA